MPQQYSGRLTVVLVVFLGRWRSFFRRCSRSCFTPKSRSRQWVKLKPGIDMVGGTSLVYQIKRPPGTPADPQLATKVAAALKKRVDPQGVMNLIWRPQGADRLEIQMPNTGAAAAEAREKRDQLLAAEKQLEQTNVSLSEVIDAVEQQTGTTAPNFRSWPTGARSGWAAQRHGPDLRPDPGDSQQADQPARPAGRGQLRQAVRSRQKLKVEGTNIDP